MHKVLSVIRAQDFAICWNYPQGKRVGYVWSDVRRNHKKAFNLQQVSKMIGRHYITLKRDILDGKIKPPQKTYALNANKTPGTYYMSEQDVYDLHDYLLSVHVGRPRKDGKVTIRDMPSKAELRAMMKHDIVTYVKTAEGEFVPVWKEQDW